jgi:hypothetical protein
MPTLPPGTPQSVNLTYTPTWIFTANTSATNTVRLYNAGTTVAYVGGANVTATTGMPIPPKGRPVELTGVTGSLYAMSQYYQTGVILGTVSSAATVGTTSFTFAATGVVSALPVGSQFIIESTQNTSNQEVLNVAGSTSTTVLTTSAGALFAHDTTNVVYACTPTYGQIQVTYGVA